MRAAPGARGAAPRSLAIYGASASKGTFGHSLLAASLGWASAGRVYPVNPRYA